MCGSPVHSRAQWPLVVVGSLISFIRPEPCEGPVRARHRAAARAGSRTPCALLTFAEWTSEARGPSGSVPCPLCAGCRSAPPPVPFFSREEGFAAVLAQGRLRRVAAGGGGVVCCSAIWPVSPSHSLTLVAAQESRGEGRCPARGPSLRPQKLGHRVDVVAPESQRCPPVLQPPGTVTGQHLRGRRRPASRPLPPQLSSRSLGASRC